MPLGKGDWNTIAAAYRQYAEKRGYAVTLREKIRRDPHVELMVGARCQAVVLPDPPDERGQHGRGIGPHPLDIRRGRPGRGAPAQ